MPEPRVEHQHPPTVTAAADGSHTQGCMIALMPTPEDAERLAVPDGEPADELHCTLYYLGDDGGTWPSEARDAMEAAVRERVPDVPPVACRIFGAAHWNGDGDTSSWVWSVGDNPSRGPADSTLEEAGSIAGDVIGMTMSILDGDMPETPTQHSPWVAHICAAYSDDPAFLPELEQRLGPVTFDRIRLSFGDDDRDIPLAATAVNLTAAALTGPLRRDPTETELASRADFATVHTEWENATTRALSAMRSTTAAWRLDLRKQVTALLADDDPEAAPGLTLSTLDATETLTRLMEEYALSAGQTMQREAEAQGVKIPAWSLPADDGDAVTAAIGGRRLLASVAQLSSDLMASTLITATKRKLSGLLRSGATPEAVASEVDRELATVDDSGVRAAVGQAMTAAQNAGRHAVMDAAPPARSYVASEILDKRCCQPCKTIDGRAFTTLADAVAEYPVMGYLDCVGPKYGNACRGFIVAVWQEVREPAPATTASAFHGNLGDPGYHELHPGNQGKGKTRSEHGGMLGSPDYSEEEHLTVVKGYTEDDSEDMNDLLRHDTLPGNLSREEVEDRNRALNDLINVQDPLSDSVTLYRGSYAFPGDLQVGDEITDRGFVSFSASERVGRRFAGQSKSRRDKSKPQGLMATVTIPAGTRILQVASVDPDQDMEDEWVGLPGSRFRVTDVSGDGLDIGLELIP